MQIAWSHDSLFFLFCKQFVKVVSLENKIEREHQDQLVPVQMQYLTSFTLMYVDNFKFHHLVERNILSHSLMILVVTPRHFFYDQKMKFFGFLEVQICN